MRVVGAITFLLGAAAVARLVVSALAARRPRDLLLGLGAAVAAGICVLGLVLVFAPGFVG